MKVGQLIQQLQKFPSDAEVSVKIGTDATGWGTIHTIEHPDAEFIQMCDEAGFRADPKEVLLWVFEI